MQLNYFYSNNCGCCKDYESVIERIFDELAINTVYTNIDEAAVIPHLKGVPTVQITDDGKILYQHTGNLPYEKIIEEIRKCL